MSIHAGMHKASSDHSKVDVAALVISVASIAASVLGNFQPEIKAGTAVSACNMLYNTLKLLRKSSDVDVIPNPWFVANGHDSEDNVATKAYLYSRKLKSIGGTGIGFVGGLASAGTAGHDVLSAVRHGNAIATTAIYLGALERIARRQRSTGTVADWCLLIQRMKIMKAAVRGTQLAGAVVPAASMPIGIAAAVASSGIALTMNGACYACAAAIHWRAFQEHAISGSLGHNAGKVGPASQIMYEVLSRRGVTRLLGSYDVAKLVLEPAGWQALGDKLTLI